MLLDTHRLNDIGETKCDTHCQLNVELVCLWISVCRRGQNEQNVHLSIKGKRNTQKKVF